MTGRGLPQKFESATEAAKQAVAHMNHPILHQFLKIGVHGNQDQAISNWNALIDAMYAELHATPQPES